MGLLDRLGVTFGSPRLETSLLSGIERRSGQPLAFTFSGTAAVKEYHAHLAFSEPPQEIKLGALPLHGLGMAVAARFPECALSFVELDDQRAGLARWLRSDLVIPVWMQLEIELKDSLESSLRRSRFKNIRKLIRANGLTSEIRTDDAAFDEFFHQMYLPNIQARHGAKRVAADYDGLKSRFRLGELITIKHRGEIVGGSLVDFGHKEPRMLEMGLKGGAPRYLKLGVAEAVYWFSFERILEKGGGRVGLGNSRPYVRDGAFQYKLSIGARLAAHHYRKTGLVHIHFIRRTPGLEGYLAANPFISVEDGRYVVCGFADDGRDGALALARDMLRCQGPKIGHRLYITPGMSSGDVAEIRNIAEGLEVADADRLLRRQA